MMKKSSLFIAIFVILLTFCISSLCPIADTEAAARLRIEQTSEVTENGEFTVRISTEQIALQNGIICAAYKLYYPSSVELISWENQYPSAWKFDDTAGSALAEDWSCITQEGDTTYFLYTVFNIALDSGVTEDNVLYTDFTFRAQTDSSHEFEIKEISFADEQLNSYDLPDQTFSWTGASSDVSDASSASNGVQDEVRTVSVIVTVDGLKNGTAVSGLEFVAEYDTSVLRFTGVSAVTPSDWKWEDVNLTATCDYVGSACLRVNAANGLQVSTNDAFGIRLEFEIRNADFAERMISLSDVRLLDANGAELNASDYHLNIRYEGDGFFEPNENEGRWMKILIVIITVVILLAAAMVTFIVMRKKMA